MTSHDQTQKIGARGPKFSGHADIKGHANFGAPDPKGR